METDRQDRLDAECVRAVLRGRVEAFDELVRRYQRQATTIAYRLLNQRDDAMEVVQEAFLKAFEKLSSLSRPGRFRPWFMRIVSNLALNRRRARSLRKMASLESFEDAQDHQAGLNLPDRRAPRPDQIASAKDLQEQITRRIEQLPEMQRQALLLFSIAKLPQNQVAEILGCSVEAVKWNVFMARKKLKDELAEYF